MFCLNNVVIQHQDEFYKQNNGIITGDNHSVSIANITLHYIIWPIKDVLKQAVIFKRFIDDIIWLSYGKIITDNIKTILDQTFNNNGLELTFRESNTSKTETSIEFLDIDHCINAQSPKGFTTKDFIKPTAVGRCFLNGNSFHPPHVFKSIVFSEAIRLRRLNENNTDFLESLQRLKTKCVQSKFNKNITDKIINEASSWQDRFGPPCNKPSQNKTPLIWATSFTNIIKLTHKEHNLIPNSIVVYKKPATLHKMLTNYSKIAHNMTTRSTEGGSSIPCGNCALCGNFGRSKSMVKSKNFIQTTSDITVRLTQNLTCSNYGIYAAQCKICNEVYVGQTKNRFSIRWSGHRSFWKTKIHQLNVQNNKTDQAALLKHIATHHSQFYSTKPQLPDCYEVIFLQQPTHSQGLDLLESKWIRTLAANINIQKTILPRF